MENNSQTPQNIFSSPFVGVTAVILLSVVSFVLGAGWMRYSNTGDFFKGDSDTVNTTGTTAETLAIDNLPGAAKAAGVKAKDFQKCVDEKRYAQLVTDSVKQGGTYGINGTPGGFVVNVNTGKAVQVRGALPFADLQTSIQQLIDDTIPSADLYSGNLPQLTDEPSGHVRGGDESVKVIMYEYSDYECPFCKKFHPTTKQLLDEFNGQLALIYRHFPLESIHPKARPAAEASECVFELGGEEAFWKFTDYIFEN